MRWIGKGLCFECQPDCGQCCTHSVFGDGDLEGVFLTKRDRQRLQRAGLAEAIELREEAYVLKERDGTCIFLDEATKGCGIYAVRPTQCRNFPFGPGRDSPVATRANWTAAKEHCPGIDVGRFYSKRAIRKLVRNRVEHGSFEV